MDGLRHFISLEILVNLFSDERNHRTGDLAESHQNPVQGIVGLLLVLIVGRFPETSSTAADVPIVQVLDERDELAADSLNIVRVKSLCACSMLCGLPPWIWKFYIWVLPFCLPLSQFLNYTRIPVLSQRVNNYAN